MAAPNSCQLTTAIQEQQFLIEKETLKSEPYSALYDIYFNAKQYDQAWCLASALTYLQRANRHQTQLFEQYKRNGLIRAKSHLSDEMWTHSVYHPDEESSVRAICAALYPAVGMMTAHEHTHWGLKRQERRDFAHDPMLFSRVFNYVMQFLNVPANLELFFRPDQPGGLQIAHCREKQQFIPSIIVKQDMLTGRSDKALALHIALLLSKMRPEHFLQNHTELSCAITAAIHWVTPHFNVPPDKREQVAPYIEALRQHLSRSQKTHLKRVVQQFVQSKRPLDIEKWTQAVELTGHRTALIISNDLSQVANFISQTAMEDKQPKEQIKALLMYAISPQYFALRQQLGITIS